MRERIPTAQRPDTYLFAAGVGVIGGLVGTLFQLATHGLQRGLIGAGSLLEAAKRLPWYEAIAIPFVGACVAGLLGYWLARRRSTQGMSDVMEAVSLRRVQELSVRRTVSRGLSSLALIATGGSLGREGPIAYMSASIGARLGRLSRIPRARLGLFAGCGVAAGMSASYYAPFGAALFAMEVVLGNFSIDVLAPVVVSAVVAALVVAGLSGEALLGDWVMAPPLYRLPKIFEQPEREEYLVYLALGIAAAFAAWLFIWFLRETERLFRAIPVSPMVRLPLGGLLVGAMGIWLPHVWGNGYDAVNLVLTGSPWLHFVAVLFVMKMVATSITLGSGGSGGLFTPTIFVGSALGLIVGTAAAAMFPFVSDPHHFAVVGMAAVLAATTHAPIMAIMMLFEMTLEVNLIVPLMITAITASVTSRIIGLESVYMAALRRKGTAIPEGIEETALTTTCVEDIMRAETVTARENAVFSEIVDRVQKTRNNAIYVVDSDEVLQGVIRLHDIKNHLAQDSLGAAVIALDLMVRVATAEPEDSLAAILDRFDDPELGEMPVVQPDTGVLLGVVDRRDLISTLSVEVLKGGRRAKFVEYEGTQHYVELEPGHGMARITAPEDLVGWALRDTEFRGRTGCTILNIVRGGERLQAQPDSVIEKGDELIVMGPKDEIRRLGGEV